MSDNNKPIFVIFSLLIFASFILVLLFGARLFRAQSELNVDYKIKEESGQKYLQRDQFITESISQTISQPTVTSNDPIRGNAGAKITIVEFSDFSCPFCAKVQTTLHELGAIYKNNIRFVWKDFPNTSLHKNAKSLHIAARCAEDQGKFWEYQELLFANQGKFSKAFYNDLALQLKLDLLEFNTCLGDKRQEIKIDKDIEEGAALQISATPTFYINNIKIEGLTGLEEFKSIIDEQLPK